MLILIVAGGHEKGRVYEFADDRDVTVGREGADIALTDSRVSRRHGRLWCDGGRWYVQDTESRHGIYRNHAKIAGTQPLKDGDYLQLGRTVLVVARVPAEVASRAGLLPYKDSGAGPGVLRRNPRLVVGGLAAAAAVLISLNAVSLWSSRSGLDRIEGRIAAESSSESQRERAMRSELAAAFGQKKDHEARVETMIAAFQPRQDEIVPQLAAIRTALDAKPSAEQVAAAVRADGDAAAAVLARIAERLDRQEGLATEMAELRRVIDEQPTGDAELRPLLEAVLARVETLDPAADREQVLAAIGAVKAALPADPSARLDDVLARLDRAQHDPHLARVDARLEELAAQLARQGEAQFIQDQLAAVLDARREGRDPAGLAEDPLMGQLLARVDALAAQDVKLDAILADLQKQPYRNRAILDEALAQAAGTGADEAELARQLDNAMAELRGKSIADADELRRLIRREVADAVGREVDPAAPVIAERETRLTKTEQAYKAAFETGRRVTVGAGLIDPGTGERAAGRTLDPVAAREAGHASWRDWYLMDDFAERARLNDAAVEVTVNASPVRPATLPEPQHD